MGPHRNTSDLIDLFEKRGMIIDDKDRASEKIKFINYYKLKELAYPFSVNDSNKTEPHYEKITFDALITRYYQDKRIRLELMACIENIEIAFKTRFSYYLGEQFGELGYYKFNNWCNKNEYCIHYIREKQGAFKNRLKENEYLFASTSIQEHFEKSGIKMAYDKIPIWLYVEFATFGEILELYKLMSKGLREKISNDFECTPTEIESWLGNLKFIRNKIAHNSNIIDIKFRTKPKLKDDWKKYMDSVSGNQVGGLAETILIVVFFTCKINKLHRFNDLQSCINKLVDNSDFKAKMLGFKDKDSSIKAIGRLGGHFSKSVKYTNSNRPPKNTSHSPKKDS